MGEFIFEEESINSYLGLILKLGILSKIKARLEILPQTYN